MSKKRYTHSIATQRCPYCGRVVNAAGEHPGNDGGSPIAGCFMVCIACAGLMRFNEEDLTLRKADMVEALAIHVDLFDKLQRTRFAILTLKARRPNWPGNKKETNGD